MDVRSFNFLSVLRVLSKLISSLLLTIDLPVLPSLSDLDGTPYNTLCLPALANFLYRSKQIDKPT